MSLASGLQLLSTSERNPLKTTTFGTGQLIKNCLMQGFRKIHLLIGGSATNDAGMGMAVALGY
jgi:glycerate kinase